MKTRLTRGQKLCKECGCVNASRQRICRGCNTEFIAKNTPINKEVKDWKNLQKNDYIKIVQGTGPYYVNIKDSEESKVGDRVCMGDIGVYKVIRVEPDGIRVYGMTKKNAGYSFLYMGKPSYSEKTGIYREPYRIKKVKRRIK